MFFDPSVGESSGTFRHDLTRDGLVKLSSAEIRSPEIGRYKRQILAPKTWTLSRGALRRETTPPTENEWTIFYMSLNLPVNSYCGINETIYTDT